MILTLNELVITYLDGEEDEGLECLFSLADVQSIMKEVERRTIAETRDGICNKLDDFLHPLIYGDEG